jgi:uncharacterized protein YggU (UPF0235/DUF167 family)
MFTTLPSAIRLIAHSPSAPPTLYIKLLVKSNTSFQRAGILAITPQHVHLGVTARAQNGEANVSVRKMVAKALRVAMTDVRIERGLKSVYKVVGVNGEGLGDVDAEGVRGVLEAMIVKKQEQEARLVKKKREPELMGKQKRKRMDEE